jgi:hypothetical protein
MLLQLGSLEQAAAVGSSAGAGLVVEEVRQPDPTGVVACVRRTGG